MDRVMELIDVVSSYHDDENTEDLASWVGRVLAQGVRIMQDDNMRQLMIFNEVHHVRVEREPWIFHSQDDGKHPMDWARIISGQIRLLEKQSLASLEKEYAIEEMNTPAYRAQNARQFFLTIAAMAVAAVEHIDQDQERRRVDKYAQEEDNESVSSDERG